MIGNEIVTQDQLKTLVRGTYDIQALRIAMGNRLVGNFKVKLGIKPGTKEKDLSDQKKQRLLKVIRMAYQRITDGIITLDTEGEGIISTETEMTLVRQYIELLKREEAQFKDIGKIVAHFTLWQDFLKDVRGVGPAMAGVILSEFDPRIGTKPSSFIAFAGLDVATDPERAHVADGKGRSRRKEHQITVEYTNKAGKKAKRESITFNTFVKTKMIGVLGPSFLRAGVPCEPDCEKKSCINRGSHTTEFGSPYGKVYANYRHRLENHAVYGIANEAARIAEFKEKGKKYAPKAHRHNMAIRYMVKIFLIDLHVKWREVEGLPVTKPYHVAKLEMREHRIAS